MKYKKQIRKTKNQLSEFNCDVCNVNEGWCAAAGKTYCYDCWIDKKGE